MTAVEIIQGKGFVYSGDCAICSGRYQIYRNANYPTVEIKVKKQNGLTKIYKQGRQVATASADNLSNALTNAGIS